MNNVIQLFPKKVYIRSARSIALAEMLDMEQTMKQLEHTLQCYQELVVTLEDPRDMFVARQFVNETQEELNVLRSNYHRKFSKYAS